MKISQPAAARPASLKANIRQVEDRLIERRHRIGTALGGVAHSVADGMVSPGTILAAGLFGAMLHQDNRLRGLRLLTILQTANASVRLLLTMSSRPVAAANAPAGHDSSPVGV
jgi:hypothetical protein